MDIRTYESIADLELRARAMRSAYITGLIRRAFTRLFGSSARNQPTEVDPSEVALERR